MPKYLVVYHAPTAVMQQMASLSAEQQKQGMDAWMAWAKSCGNALLDLGTPLGNGKSVSPGGTADSDKEVCGYSMIEANSMNAAIELLRNHPHFHMPGQCSIEVHEGLALPGM